MRGHQLHLHPGATSEHLRARGRSTAHLQTGSCEGSASGFYVAAMALIVLGIASRSMVRTLALDPTGRLEDFEILGHSPEGIDDSRMSVLWATAGNLVRVKECQTAKRSQLIRTLVNELEHGAVCAVSTSPDSFQYHEWILAIGVEYRCDGGLKRPTALLTLDPRLPCDRIAAWNGRLELNRPPDARQLFLNCADGSLRSVFVRSAFVVSTRGRYV